MFETTNQYIYIYILTYLLCFISQLITGRAPPCKSGNRWPETHCLTIQASTCLVSYVDPSTLRGQEVSQTRSELLETMNPVLGSEKKNTKQIGHHWISRKHLNQPWVFLILWVNPLIPQVRRASWVFQYVIIFLPVLSREWMGIGDWDYYWYLLWIIPSFPAKHQ